jgi:hypothetical protein
MQYNIIKTKDGYMVEQDNGDYLCDAEGNNLFDWYFEAEAAIAMANGGESVSAIEPWDKFNRMRGTEVFYGCVAPDGSWFDSGMVYTTAVTHCCYYAGQFGLSLEDEALWMNTEGAKLGYSVIHSSMLEKMYKKGLLK